MNTYQEESLSAGATHLGAKGHGWRLCPLSGNWQVYKLGAGWVTEQPASELTPLVMQSKPTAELWERVKRAMNAHEANATLGTLYDLREAIDQYDVEVCK